EKSRPEPSSTILTVFSLDTLTSESGSQHLPKIFPVDNPLQQLALPCFVTMLGNIWELCHRPLDLLCRMLVIYSQVNGNNMKGQPMKATGYCRVSSQEQVDGTSLKSQEDQIRAYCAMKGIDLAGVLVDAGVSGGKPLAERPEGSKLTSMVESGE